MINGPSKNSRGQHRTSLQDIGSKSIVAVGTSLKAQDINESPIHWEPSYFWKTIEKMDPARY
jgi:hypothetical protein